jgi:hypothetical protein
VAAGARINDKDDKGCTVLSEYLSSHRCPQETTRFILASGFDVTNLHSFYFFNIQQIFRQVALEPVLAICKVKRTQRHKVSKLPKAVVREIVKYL